MKKLFYITVFACLFFSCKKKHTLKVTVTNVGTGKPMPNNGVYITELTNKVEGLGGGTVTHDFYSGKTDENGELYITEKFDTRYTYEVSVDLPDNWAYVENVSYTMVPKDKYWNNGIDFKIATAAYLKLSIHNVNCQGSGDTMRFRSRYSYSDWEGWSSYRVGCYTYDDMGGGVKVSMGWRVYQWEVTRNGSVNYYTDSVFIPENDTVWFIMNY